MASIYKDWLIDNLHVRLFVARVDHMTSAWSYEFKRVSHWRIYRNDRDGPCLELPTGTLPLQGGDVYILPAGLTFHTRTLCDFQHFYIHFDVVGLPNIALRQLFRAPIRVPFAPALEMMIDDVIRELMERPDVQLGMQWRLKAIVYEALGQYLHTVPQEKAETCWQIAHSLEPVVPALRYIEENLAAEIRNEALAIYCALNRDYFIRKFKECVGQSPMQYVMERRVDVAAQRLLFTTQTIDQIAEETGFCNRAHLSRRFKQYKGVSPAHYRQTTRH